MSILRTQQEIKYFKAVNSVLNFVARKSWFCLVFLIVLACGKQEAPEGVLTPEQMVNVLSELYIAEEKIKHVSLPPDSAEVLVKLFEQKVYEKTGVADTLFRKSFDYYMDRPKELELIYSNLVDALQLKEERTRRNLPVE